MPLTATEGKALIEALASAIASVISDDDNVAEAQELPLEPEVEASLPETAEPTAREYPSREEKAARRAANQAASKAIAKALKEGHKHVTDGEIAKAKRSLAKVRKIMRGRVAEVGPNSQFTPDGSYAARVTKLDDAIKAVA